MTIKETLRAARGRLRDKLSGWKAAPRRPLSADPLLCASCLRWAIHHNAPELGLAAASTLLLFEPARLANTLVLAAVETCGSAQMDLLEEVLALGLDFTAKLTAEARWRQAVVLIKGLCAMPTNPLARDLSRLSIQFQHSYNSDAEAASLGAPLGHLEAGLLRRLGFTLSAPEAARSWPEKGRSLNGLLDAYAAASVPWNLLDVAELAWKRTRAGAALALPLDWLLYRDSGGNIAPVRSRPGCDIPLQALTHATTQGHRALATWLQSSTGVAELIERAGAPMGWRVEVAGCCLERAEEEPTEAIAQAAQWCGVPWLSAAEANAVGGLLRANGAAIDEIRAAHIPTLGADYRRHR